MPALMKAAMISIKGNGPQCHDPDAHFDSRAKAAVPYKPEARENLNESLRSPF